MTTGRLSLIAAALGFRDWIVEWRLSLCLALGVAAAAAPLLVLFSIRAGIVEGMREQLVRDPSSRELHTTGQAPISMALLAQLRGRPEVGFVAPTIRLLAANAVLRTARGSGAEPVDLVPSGAGDPLAAVAGAHAGYRTLIVSQLAARELNLAVGQPMLLVVDRVRVDGVHEAAKLRLRVDGILPPWAADRRLALIDTRVLMAIERFREDPMARNFATAQRLEVRDGRNHVFAGVRIYARTIDDVAALRDWLMQHGLITEGRLSEIRLIQQTSGALMMVFLLIAAVVGAGLCLSLAAAQWAWVERRRRDLGYLRLIGLEPFQLALLPAVQSLMSVTVGIAVGVALAEANSVALNRTFAERMAGFGTVSRLAPMHVMVAVAMAMGAGVVASLLASIAASKVTPASVLRET